MTDRVLVTGGSGFVGRRLVRFLKDADVDVLAPGRDILNVAAGSFPDVSVDWVIHLAGRTYVPASWSEPADFYRVNALGTVNVLEYCRRTHAKLIHVSGYCYGIPESLPLSETAPLKPNNPYALSKCAAEEACRFFFECLQMPVMIVRPFNIYGPGQSASFLIPRIVEQAIDPDVAAIVVEDETPRRDYVHLDDVIGAIESLRRSPKLGGTFNIGSGESYSVAEVAEMVRSAANVSKPFVSRGNRRVNDIPDVIADITAIRDAAGWSPSITLRDGLRDVVTHAKARGGSGAVV
ncbi:nucleoside-diphosphate-sugar epimerase [Bradyrhizobium sp. CIR18]|uniref:NAD-dependent epimerase/dehydratase family protein n=1 Tax=Bradyrhizobium sp. CIR18 TaxID=2663839 RepID=UPI001606CAF8|nr:NAD-dependent epimerase/dehydratase family protein [Bradyrhizobium sp. CIR18]MBB4361492.1 nucleoside-diphosphate-sugar epimerase [Bradyrhizobium sp. CIR18]